MNLHIENKVIAVGNVRIVGVASSSVFLIGDTEVISLSSMFDTPLESIVEGLAPLPLES
ncbi:spore germination protein PD [Paenibacillus eucommiae]|uniref:Spore germination protein PD n=1 Tax=Paenibacillus eucommiae TaxID=1355755 RepID=A0ABS4IXU9_9BACL|nr:spore germination protein [Paenibacillus eucommiae]MBP1992388.1 spore germination protein PD [Paenibacillus eucommiae]